MLKNIKFDKGWKLLIYFDIIVPAILYAIALLTDIPFLSGLFHAYEIFIVSPIINFASYIGIVGFVYHLGIIIYAIKKRDLFDIIFCIIITIAIAAFFWFEINYLIIKPLNFMRF